MKRSTIFALTLSCLLLANGAWADDQADILHSAGFGGPPPAPPALSEEMKAQMKKDGVATPQELAAILEKCKGKGVDCPAQELKAAGFAPPIAPKGPAPAVKDAPAPKGGARSAM